MFVTGLGAPGATLIGTIIFRLSPGSMTPSSVQLTLTLLHEATSAPWVAPSGSPAVRPAGSVSVTVIGLPSVGWLPEL